MSYIYVLVFERCSWEIKVFRTIERKSNGTVSLVIRVNVNSDKSTGFERKTKLWVLLCSKIKLYASRNSLDRSRQQVFTRRARCVRGALGRALG